MGFFFDTVAQFTHGRNLDTSDEALDAAAGFQQGFQEYLPLYNDYTGSLLSLRNDIQRPYDELREIDFRRLSEVAERGAAIADEFQETREQINTRVAGVTEWSGDAANAFQAHIQRFQTVAQTVDGELGQIASATGEAVPAAQSIIAEYADTIGEIDFSGFDSPELIRILLTIERMAMSVSELVDRLYDGIGDLIGMALPVFSSGGGGLFGSIPVVGQVVDTASDLVGDFIGGVLDFFGGADDLLALASRLARSYLDASFKQPFENNLELLTGAVEAAKQSITEVFQPVTDAAGAVTLEGFTALGDAPEVGPQPPSSSAMPVIGEPIPAGSQPSGAAEPMGSPSLPAGTSDTSGTVIPPETTSTAGGVPAAGPGMEPVPQPEPSPTAQPEPLPIAGDPDRGEATILPAAGDFGSAPPETSMRLGDRTIAFAPVGAGEAVGITLTSADGDSVRYEIRIDEQGNPQLLPATTVPAADGFGSEAVAGASFAAGAIGSVLGAVGGEISAGDEGYAAASESGRTVSGSVSFGGGSGTEPGGGLAAEPGSGSAAGSARLASVSTASDLGTVTAPGEAHLASAAEGIRAEQHGGGGLPFVPMGSAAAGGGDEERHGGLWQVPGTDVFETEDEPIIAQGVLGGDR